MENTVSMLKVQGMSCSHCQMAVEKTLVNLKGVNAVDVDLLSGKVNVDYDPVLVNLTQMVNAIEEAGFTVLFDHEKNK
ncbi:MAG: cation transporter [Bacillota bacterium]|jgi:copper chaperone